MVARERASERCLAAWRRRSLPRTMVYVCQLHARSRPYHRARGEARRHQQDRRQAHGDPDCPVRFGTHDGRVAHSAHLRKLHSASRHLRLGGRDLTEYIMKWFSLHPRGRVLWISQRNSASWRGLRHSAHDCCSSQGEDQRAHRQHLHCWRQTPPFWPLPAFLLRHIWLCQLDSELYVVALWSFVFHGLWLGASAVLSPILELHDRQIRGWAMLMSVSAMNSFLYLLLLRHPGFVERPTWARTRQCPGTRYPVWSCTATTYSAPPAVTYEASPPVAPALTHGRGTNG